VVLAERWIRYGAAAFVAGACVRFTSPDASPLPAFLAAAYGAMLPRLAEAGAAGERDRERWATNLPSDLVVVGAGLSPFAFWLLRGLVRYPAGSWEHLIAQAAFQLATVTSAVALASWVSLRWPTPLHWHHHAALPWVFLAVTLELGGQYPIAAWTLAGWAVHLAVDALGPQGVVCAGRRAAARLYSGALRPALALFGMLAAGCLWILGLRWTPSHPLHARLAPLPARPGTVTSVPVPGVLLAAGAACAAVAIRSWAAASRIAGSPPRGEDMRFLPEQVGVQLHPDALDGMPYLPVLVGLGPRAAGRPVAMLCCLEPPRPDERAVELRFDGRSTRFDLVSPSRFRPEWYGARLPDAWAGNGPCGVVPLHGAAGEILLAAQAYAKRHGHRLVDEWHVVSCACFRLQRRLERLLERATQNLERLAPLAPLRDDSALIVSPEVVRLLVRAEEARVRAGAPKAALWKYLWLTTIHAYGRGHSAWYDWAREEDVVLRMPDELPPPAPEPGRGQAPGGGHARAESRKATVEPVSSEAEVPSILDEMCQELVALARRGALPPVYGRDAELDQMVETLTRAEKCNPVLVGEPGVGKTAVVHLLAQTVAHHPERLPERLRGLRIYEWDHPGMVAGTQYRGQFEERLKQLLDALSAHPNAVLFVDEIHLLVGAGRAEGGAVPGAGQLLKPALASGRIRVMGATTPSEYRVIESDPALERRFQPVWVRELSPEMAERALRAVIAPDLEHRHGVRIHPQAIQAAVAGPRVRAELHDADDKPFTLSPLWGLRRLDRECATLLQGQSCWFRVTALTAPVGEVLEALAGREVTFRVGEATLRVRRWVTAPDGHPWAGTTSYQVLVDRWASVAAPPRRVALEFATPTAFRVGRTNVPLPLPGLVFGSLERRWRAWSRAPLPHGRQARWTSAVRVARYELRTRMADFGAYRQVGFTGRCEFEVPEGSDGDARALQVLAEFAFYAGVGSKTAMGMGQARSLPPVSQPRSAVGTRRPPSRFREAQEHGDAGLKTGVTEPVPVSRQEEGTQP
jgi:CRISPR-associated endoribonuclease Cas6